MQAKQAADLHTSTLSQYLALELVSNGFLEEFLPVLRQTYRERRDLMLRALEKHFPKGAAWVSPEGGMFLLVKMPNGADTTRLLPEAISQKVAYVPGEEFHLDGAGHDTLRLNFSNARPQQIEAGIERLARIVRLTGCPSQTAR